MYIQLLCDFKGISPREWEDAWLKCIEILDTFPVPVAMAYPQIVVRKKGEAFNEETYYVWSDRIVSDEGTGREYLAFRSDYISLESGGVFSLFRHSSCYADHPTSEKDIVWQDPETWRVEQCPFSHIGDDPRSIWDNGTKGAPYFMAVLALGIYLESRFPESCLLHGDYSPDQLEPMRSWLYGALDASLPLPLCNDPGRLFDRILPLYSDPYQTVRCFLALSKLKLHETFAFLIEKGCNEPLRKVLVKQLKYYSTPLQWGASDILIPYLEAIRDVEELVTLTQSVQKAREAEAEAEAVAEEKEKEEAEEEEEEEEGEEEEFTLMNLEAEEEEEAEEGDEFTLMNLLKLLVNRGVTVKPYATGSELAREWNNPGEGLTTGIEALNRIFFRLAGLPNKVNYYLPDDELLEIFACTEPANGVEFKQIIAEGAKEVAEQYSDLEEVTEEISTKMAEKDTSELSSYFVSKAQWIRRRHLPSEEYILQEVERQCFDLYNPEKCALMLAKAMGENLVGLERQSDRAHRVRRRSK